VPAHFATNIPANSDSYSIAIDDLGTESEHSRSDLEQAGWKVALKS
jgi:hypothetical protein